MTGDAAHDAACLAENSGLSYLTHLGSKASGQLGVLFDGVKVEGCTDDGYLVSWYDANGAEATETFASPLAAVERAIQLQKELA